MTAIDTEFGTQIPRVAAVRTFSQKKGSQEPIENNDEEDCTNHQSKLKAQIHRVSLSCKVVRNIASELSKNTAFVNRIIP